MATCTQSSDDFIKDILANEETWRDTLLAAAVDLQRLAEGSGRFGQDTDMKQDERGEVTMYTERLDDDGVPTAIEIVIRRG